MSGDTLGLRDEYDFLRQRAMQLLDEGLKTKARRLLAAIDKEQARRIAAELQKLERHGACGEM